RGDGGIRWNYVLQLRPIVHASALGAGRIAWVFAYKRERNVWIADAPNFEARQVTHYVGDDGMPIAALKLTPDGKTVAYARGGEVNGAGETADPTSNVDKCTQQAGRRRWTRTSLVCSATWVATRRTAKTSRYRRTVSSRCGP